jgi:ABC-2 type transport system permease protein
MWTIFNHSLRRLLWQILGWGITLGLVTLYLMWIYKPMISQQAQLANLFKAYGQEMLSFFGGAADFISPGGYLDFGFFSYMPVVAGIFVILIGSGLLVADEEKGTLDLVLAHPLSRTALFFGQLLAFIAATVAILLLTWAGFACGLPLAGLDTTIWKMLLPHLSLLATLFLFGSLNLFLSLILPSRSAAASLSGFLLVASYVVTSLARVNDKLTEINKISPLKYYQGGHAVNGLDWNAFLGALGVSLLFALIAWLLFLRRDIRVSGTSSWQMLSLWGKEIR